MPAATDVDVWQVSDTQKRLYQVTLKITDQLNGNGNYKLLLHVSQHKHYKLKMYEKLMLLIVHCVRSHIAETSVFMLPRWILFYDLDLFVFSEFWRNWIVS